MKQAISYSALLMAVFFTHQLQRKPKCIRQTRGKEYGIRHKGGR
jgi:hypothetical protein